MVNDKIDNVIDLANFDADKLISRYGGITVNGYHVLVFIYKPPIAERTTSGRLYLPPSAIEEDYEYRSMVGLVLKVGNEAYPPDKFDFPWCIPGDWVTFPRANGVQFRCDGALLINVPDDKILNVIDNPVRISR